MDAHNPPPLKHVTISKKLQKISPQLHTLSTETSNRERDVLLVDLNNFSSFPTLAIGLLVASLRSRGHNVKVLCPLAYDVPATERERRENFLDHLKRRVHLSDSPFFRRARDLARSWRSWQQDRLHPRVAKEFSIALESKPQIVLFSAYLQHYRIVCELSKRAESQGIPVVVGGPMFNVRGVSDEWKKIPGVKLIVGAEADLAINEIVENTISDRPLSHLPGLHFPDGTHTGIAAPLRNLDDAPFADFTDFPWDRYPVRIVPIMTGRGCQWNHCVFCSDVVSASGRSFRTRSVDNVLVELQEQSIRHKTTNFLFLDLKLNSYPEMFRRISQELHRYVHGAEWIGTVHVDKRDDNGLSKRDLKAAVAGGMRRISFGLESGSQRLLDLMQKGCDVGRNSEFIRNAHEAGLSVRCTMFKGFPGETVEDMQQTADFLQAHLPYLDRVRFNDFSLLEDTPIYNEMLKKSELNAISQKQSAIEILRLARGKARAEYINHELTSSEYRRAKRRALSYVYEINRRPVRSSARQFDGLM